MESVAPMMKQIQMEREDMLLQGPSRKALQVSDVSTSQGASELTRLLRGDDSAKDLNLAELKKQSQKMEDLIDAVKAANPTVLL
jgi:RNA polymerase-interacting CarD/CdnL/TRCF family regulator